MLYKFSQGAKDDLLALNFEYSFSDIVGMLKDKVPCGNVVVTLQGSQVTGVKLKHLEKPARFYTFKCVMCWDSHKIEVGDPCDFCEGEGCSDCKSGLNFKTIACPNCTGKQTLGDSDEWTNRSKVERTQRHGNGRPIPRQAKRNPRRKTSARN